MICAMLNDLYVGDPYLGGSQRKLGVLESLGSEKTYWMNVILLRTSLLACRKRKLHPRTAQSRVVISRPQKTNTMFE